ncbi:MAG: MlaE family lipid ABC transporter permease subunit [Pseudomonadota bacterium]
MINKEDQRDGKGAAGNPLNESAETPGLGYSVSEEDVHFDEVRICVSGTVSIDNAEYLRRDLVRAVESQPMKNVVIDLGSVDYFDTSGEAILQDIFQTTDDLHTRLKLINVPERIRSIHDLVELDRRIEKGILQPRPEPNPVVQIGEGVVQLYRNAVDILTFIGASVEALIHDTAKPGKLRWDRLWKLIDKAGSDAVPIVTMLSFLMGCILAFQAAVQLRKFGANIFVADLVSVSICLEMGPLLTALIVAGRSGAAYAAHIGTMQVNEEVDALRVMGIDPIRYLVSPRILATALALPCLTLMADLAGVAGGCLVAAFSLDITPTGYFNQVHKVLEFSDVMKGLTKSFVFGIEIAMIGCLRGIQVRGGAEGVGSATTSAVVTCIFILTVTDAMFAVLFYYGPSF